MNSIPYKSKHYPDAAHTYKGTYQGSPTIMSWIDKPVEANIYQLIIRHKERDESKSRTWDNINFFTIIAQSEEDVIPIFEEWYYKWSQSGVPPENYNWEVNLIVPRITTHHLGLIQFSYMW